LEVLLAGMTKRGVMHNPLVLGAVVQEEMIMVTVQTTVETVEALVLSMTQLLLMGLVD
jgi:hypothetical protein